MSAAAGPRLVIGVGGRDDDNDEEEEQGMKPFKVRKSREAAFISSR
jgi:hypothetical protein